MAFGVVLFTLLGQGTTIPSLLKRLGLIERPQYQVARERRLGRLLATQAGLRRLKDLRREGLLLEEMWTGLRDYYLQTQGQMVEEMNQLFLEHAELEQEILLQARRGALQAERSALGDALRRGLLSDDVYEELRSDVDHRLEAITLIWEAVQDSQTVQEGE
jgi:CPA1 family monovalent cation:H+ antiporter